MDIPFAESPKSNEQFTMNNLQYAVFCNKLVLYSVRGLSQLLAINYYPHKQNFAMGFFGVCGHRLYR